jgi:hypothetical protein
MLLLLLLLLPPGCQLLPFSAPAGIVRPLLQSLT